MKCGYIDSIERQTLKNDSFRKVLYTANHSQLVIMSILPNDAIGDEVHESSDQFIRCEAGEGKAVLNGKEHSISDGIAIVVPAGMKHNIINTSSNKSLQLYSLYSPPHHRDGVFHKTKLDALQDDEKFDGETTECQ